MKNVMLLTGAGQIGMAIARRVGYGMKIVIADKKAENAQAITKTMNEAGFDTVAVQMDLASRASIQAAIAKAQQYGPITKLVNAAGVSPSQAPVDVILKVDLYGTAVLLEEVGKAIAPGGVGVTISSQSGIIDRSEKCDATDRRRTDRHGHRPPGRVRHEDRDRRQEGRKRTGNHENDERGRI